MKYRILMALVALAIVGDLWFSHRHETLMQEAYMCALESNRTDQAIAECFTNRGLRVPEDI